MSSSIDTGSMAVKSPIGSSFQGATNGSMNQMMQELGNALVQFQVTVMSIQQKTGESRFQISDTVLHVIKRVTDDFATAMTELSAAQKQADSLSGVQKILSYVMDGLMVAASVLSQQWGMLALTVSMTALSASGAIKDIEKAISKDLQKNQHMSKDSANLLADSLTAIVLITVSLLVLGAAKAASSVQEVSAGVARVSSTIAEQEGEEMQEISNPATEEPAPAKAPEAPASTKTSGLRNPMLLAATQSIMNTSFTSDAATLAASKAPKKDQWWIELTVELVLGVLATIAGVVGMKNLSAGADMSAKTAVSTANLGRFSRLLQQANKAVESLGAVTRSNLFRGVNLMNSAALLAQSGSEFAQGATSIRLAKYTVDSAEAQASNEQYRSLLNMSQTNFNQYQNEAINELQDVDMILNQIGNAFTAVNAEEARVFG